MNGNYSTVNLYKLLNCKNENLSASEGEMVSDNVSIFYSGFSNCEQRREDSCIILEFYFGTQAFPFEVTIHFAVRNF